MDIDTLVSLLIRSNGVFLVACVLLLVGAFRACFTEPLMPGARQNDSERPRLR
jgi:hypothetical protein